MRKLSFSILVLLSVIVVHAQKNLVNGWILPNNGDTVKGLINNRQWNINPKSIEFQANGKTSTYQVSDLKAFGVANENPYQRFQITMHLLPMIDSDNIPDDETTVASSTEWLRVLVKADIALAEYRTETRPYYFVIEKNEAQELVYYKGIKSYTSDKYRNTSNYGKTGFLEVSTYRDQLLAISQKKDPALTPSNLRYTSYELISYFYKLNGLKKPTAKTSKGSFSLVAGGSYYQYKFTGTRTSGTYTGSIENSFAPILGISYTILSTRALSRGGIIFNLGVNSIKTSVASQPYVDMTSDLQFKNQYLDFSAVPIYIFNPIAASRFYGGAGLKIMVPLSSDNMITEKNLVTGVVTQKKNQPGARTILGADFRLGLLAGRMNYYIGYGLLPGNITDDPGYTIYTTNLFGCISFRFGK